MILAAGLLWLGSAQDLQHELRQAAYTHIQKLPPTFIERERSGRLMAILNEDVNQVERFLNTGANDLIQVFFSSLLIGGGASASRVSASTLRISAKAWSMVVAVRRASSVS